ncbi:MAG TPA: hypothetical protein DDW52_11690 [Planctomycetaceae bacterium]|nr:hypothetical protein [Planctomycetaceae bacterium]
MENVTQSKSRIPLVIGLAVGVVIGLPIIAFLGFCVVLGVGMSAGVVADTEVLPGNKLPPRAKKTVVASAGLDPGERIVYFYSAAISPDGDGNLLTDRRVISYVDDGSDRWCESIAIEDIVSVQFDRNEAWFEDSTIIVTSSDGTELELYASNENDGDVKFVDAIKTAAKLDEP